jgi:hypothetical protein
VQCAAKDGTVLMETVHGGLELFLCNTLLRPGCLAAACISSSSSSSSAKAAAAEPADDDNCSQLQDGLEPANDPAATGGVPVKNAAAAEEAAAAAVEAAGAAVLEGATGSSSSSSSRVWLFCPDPLCLLSKPSSTKDLSLPEW